MGSEWPISSLGETCYITDGAHSKVDRQSAGVLYLTSKNFTVGRLKLDKVDYVSEEDFQRLFADTKVSQRRLRDGDILTGIIGTFGNAYRYTEDDHFGISSSVAILRPHSDVLDSDFLYYVITSSSFRGTVNAYKGGSVQGYTNIATLKVLPIPLPDLETQKCIARSLSALDNKIELNRQTNQTLEQMAQALFKSWFVDFDPVIDNALAADNPIPDELQERAERRQQQLAKPDHKPLPDDILQLFPSEFELTEELVWVPKEWVSAQIKDICKTVQNGSTPKRMTSEFWEHGNINWFKTGELSDSLLLESGEKITEAGLEKSSCKLWPTGTVLMAIYAAPTVGRLGILSRPACSNQACTGLVPLDEIGPYYIFYSLFEARDWFNTVAVGAAQQNISKSIVENLEIIIPNNELITNFSEIVNSYWMRIENTEKETLSLTKLRDTLLPKLISGELRLPLEALAEAEQQPVDATS